MEDYMDRLLGYTTNIRLLLECLTRATTLAYFSHCLTFSNKKL